MSRIFAKIYEHVSYGGQYRWIRSDVRSFSGELGFNDKVSSIIVYKGNEFRDTDTISFHQHDNYKGGYLNLGPGFYSNIHIQPYSFGDKISSASFLPSPYVEEIEVRLVVRIYQHVDYEGEYRDILLSENNLKNVGFNDVVSSLRVEAGEDYQLGWVCDFFHHAEYAGGVLQPGKFGPDTNIPNLKNPPYSFNDVISSVRIYNMS